MRLWPHKGPARPIVEEGRLVERECPDCGGVERRAFGEFESARGELASYAFGWTSGHDSLVGHMTIGIGAGNPGGGSFHIEVADADGEYAMRLVDRPFENVPQGGPDLSRDEALAHDDIEFVWHVADEVMDQDRRARWMRHWLLGTRSFATTPVSEGTEPARIVARDAADGDWKLLCGTVPAEADYIGVLHLYHAVDHDQALLDVLDLEQGEEAERAGPGAPWIRSTYEEDE